MNYILVSETKSNGPPAVCPVEGLSASGLILTGKPVSVEYSTAVHVPGSSISAGSGVAAARSVQYGICFDPLELTMDDFLDPNPIALDAMELFKAPVESIVLAEDLTQEEVRTREILHTAIPPYIPHLADPDLKGRIFNEHVLFNNVPELVFIRDMLFEKVKLRGEHVAREEVSICYTLVPVIKKILEDEIASWVVDGKFKTSYPTGNNTLFVAVPMLEVEIIKDLVITDLPCQSPEVDYEDFDTDALHLMAEGFLII